MPNRTAYIHVEGVNLDSAVFDTDQLSVIRGGSFLLLKAIEHIQKRFKGRLEPISTGASSGLFEITDDSSPDSVTSEIVKKLNEHQYFRHFTFMVESCRCEDFRKAKAALTAKIRRRQLCTISRAPDPQTASSDGPCQLEGVRAATSTYVDPEDRVRPASEASKMRRDYGREMRAAFYREIVKRRNDEELLQQLDNYGFTQDLQSLARSDVFPHLNNKIAVIYLDGNGFGAIEQELVRDSKQQIQFDDHVQGKRDEFLCTVLRKLILESSEGDLFLHATRRNPKSAKENEPEYLLRFETLLWGGDDMLFVVPAWMGFDLVYTFYEESKNWRFQGRALTHAGGLVFCQVKTPIYRMRELAQQLADDVKQRPGGREDNYFDYIVLESIDYPVENNLDDFHRLRYGGMARYRSHLSPVPDWRDCKQQLRGLRDRGEIPRRQAYRLAQALTRDDLNTLFESPKGDGKSDFDKLEDRLIELTLQEAEVTSDIDTRKKELQQKLHRYFPVDWEDPKKRAWMWLHLVELWDYLVPDTEQHQPTEG